MHHFLLRMLCIVCCIWYGAHSFAQESCLNVLEPVTRFFQTHDHDARWQQFAVNGGQFAVLDAELQTQYLEAALKILDINNEGALFMRIEQQSLWLFKIQHCVYSLVASPLSTEHVHVQLSAFIDTQESQQAIFRQLDFPVAHHFTDLESGEEFYAFHWYEQDVGINKQRLQDVFRLSAAQIAHCLLNQLCSFEYEGVRYLLSWIKGRQEQHFLLLFSQPCIGACDVGH